MSQPHRPTVGQATDKIVLFICDTICTILLSSVSAYIFNTPFDVALDFKNALFLSCVVSVVLCVITINRYTFLISVPTVLIGAGVYFLGIRGLSPNALIARAKDFFKWFVDGAQDDGYWFETNGFSIISIILVISFCLLFVLSVRVVKKSWLTAIFCLVILVFIVLWGEEEKLIYIIFLCLGTFPIIARDFFLGNIMFSKKEKRKALNNKYPFIISASAICVLSLIFAITFVPDNTDNLRDRRASDKMIDTQSSVQVFSDRQQYFVPTTLHQLGLQPDTTRIGGNLDFPKNGYILAELKDERERFLKTCTYDYFDGFNWSRSKAEIYRIDGKDANKLDDEYKINPKSVAETEKTFTKSDVDITLKIKSCSVPIPNGLIGIKELSKSKFTIVGSTRGEIYTFALLNKDYHYKLSCYDIPVVQSGAYRTQGVFLTKIRAIIDKNDSFESKADFIDRYLQLPERWSKTLEKQADIIANKDFTDFEKAILVNDFFANYDIHYTETPGNIEKGITPLDQFVKNKLGHSVHYATAMCMMLRRMEIPCRLAAGFMTSKGNGDGVYYALSNSACAWVEVYCNGFGWISFNPVPFSSNNDESDADEQKIDELPQEKLVQQDTIEQKEEEKKKEEKQEKEQHEKAKKEKDYSYIYVILAIISVIILRGIIMTLCYKATTVNIIFRSNNKKARYYAKDIRKMQKMVGATSRHTVFEAFRMFLGDAYDDTLEKAATIINKIYYAGYNCSDDDVKIIAAAHKKHCKLLHKKVNIFKYVLRRNVFSFRIFTIL